MKKIDNTIYDTLTHRIFIDTIERRTKYDDHTAERCYLTSNEHLSHYMGDMDLTDKKVATVGSSGDQFFQALLQGSRDITIIDANPYTKVFVEYKRAMFMNLDFEQMLEIRRITKFFDCSIYRKFSHDLSPFAQRFWDTLMLEQEEYLDCCYNRFDRNAIAERMIHPELMFLCDFYNNKEIYKKLQSILKENNFSIKFKVADLNDFPKVLKDKYDLIMLSNIFGYHNLGKDLIDFEETVNKLYKKNLNPGGSIQVQYSYRKHNEELDPEVIAGHKLRIKRTGDSRLRTVYFIDKPLENESRI